MAYKRQTRTPFGLQNRTGFDPSKRLFAESQDQSKEEADFLRNDEKAGQKYNQNLEFWKKYLDEAGPEAAEVKFWTENVKTAAHAAKAIPLAKQAYQDHVIGSARKDWQEMDSDQKEEIKARTRDLFKRSGEIDWNTTNLALQLKEAGLTKYSNFLLGRSSTYQTAIMLELAEEAKNGLNHNLTNGLADTEENYQFFDVKQGKMVSFAASDIFTDPELADAKLSAYIEQHKNDVLQLATSGNIRSDIIHSLIGDKLDTIGQKFETTQLGIQSNTLANKRLKDLSSNLTHSLSLAITPSGDNYQLGEIDVADFSGQLAVFVQRAEALYHARKDPNAKEKAKLLLRLTLRQWADKQTNKEAAYTFLDDMSNGRILAYASGDNKDKIVLKDVGNLANLDPTMFGSFLTPYGSEGAPGYQGEITENMLKNNQQATRLIESAGFRPKTINGETYDPTKPEHALWVNGKLNPEWDNTWQYDMAEKYILRGDTQIPQAEIESALEKLTSQGIYDVRLFNSIRFSNRQYHSYDHTKKELNKSGAPKLNIVGHGDNRQVSSKDVEESKWNKKALLEYLDKENIQVVDQVYGGSDGGAALLALQEKVTNIVLRGTPLTPTKQAIIQEALSEVQEAILKEESAGAEVVARLGPQHDRIAFIMNDDREGSILNKLRMSVLNPGDPNHVTKEGETPNHHLSKTGWGRQERNKDTLRLNQIKSSEFQLNQYLSKPENDGKTASTSVQFLNSEQLASIEKGSYNWGRRTNKQMDYTGKLPNYVVRMALKAGEDPWAFVNNQRQKAGLPPEDNMVRPAAVEALYANGFNVKDLKTIFKIAGDNFSSVTPNKALNFTINSSINTMLKSRGLTEIPNENSARRVLDQFDYTHRDESVHGAANPQLGKYGILYQDAKRIIEASGDTFNEADFLANKGGIQETVIKLFISEINVKSWDAENTVPTSVRGTAKPRNLARVLRHIQNRITLGPSYNFDGVIPDNINIDESTLLFNGSRMLNNYRQQTHGAY